MESKQTLETVLASPHPFLFLVVPDRKEAEEKLKVFFEKDKENSELFLYNTKQVTLPLVRDIRSLSFTGGQKKKIIVLSFYTFLHDAQNALLKALEEVGVNARFIFLVESKEGILPTVLSRASFFDLTEGGGVKKNNFDTSLFLSTAPSLRLEITFVKVLLVKKDEDDKKDREYFAQFLDELLIALPRSREGLIGRKEILTFLPYARDTGSSPKMILEYLALTLPVMVE